MSKWPKKSLPNLDTPEGRARVESCNQHRDVTYFAGAWKYENEPRVIFNVHVLRCPRHPNGVKTLIGIPESLVGKPKLEKRWIEYELGGSMVKLKRWKAFILPEFRGKRLLY